MPTNHSVNIKYCFLRFCIYWVYFVTAEYETETDRLFFEDNDKSKR